MKITYLAALLAATALALPCAVSAQTLTSASGSDATSLSGSQSGAVSDQAQLQGQSQTALVGVSRNDNQSNSASNSVSGSDSRSGSVSDQGQAQTSSNANDNRANNSSTNTANVGQQVGQQATNSQGVTINQTTNAFQRRTTEVRTNNAVPLAASSSFSSDYCGGTASGGASVAPLGISLGGAAPVFDKSCQSLRRAEKFGMIAANFHNMGQPEMALKAMAMMIWSVCTADSTGPRGDATTADACSKAHLLGESQASATSAPTPGAAPEAKVATRAGTPTAEAVTRATDDARSQKVALATIGH